MFEFSKVAQPGPAHTACTRASKFVKPDCIQSFLSDDTLFQSGPTGLNIFFLSDFKYRSVGLSTSEGVFIVIRLPDNGECVVSHSCIGSIVVYRIFFFVVTVQ